MERRKFLKNFLPATAIFPSLVNGFTVKTFGATGFFEALAGAADNDHVQVLIQLSGGNDGLNTVVPISNYNDYNNLRTNIAIPADKILKLDNYAKAGLHPAMKGMQQMYNEEKLSILYSVGYPSPNQSHFRSTDIWLTGADADQYLSTGWAGRFLSDTYANFPVGYPNATMPDPLGIQIGSVLSPAFMGPGGFTAFDRIAMRRAEPATSPPGVRYRRGGQLERHKILTVRVSRSRQGRLNMRLPGLENP